MRLIFHILLCVFQALNLDLFVASKRIKEVCMMKRLGVPSGLVLFRVDDVGDVGERGEQL